VAQVDFIKIDVDGAEPLVLQGKRPSHCAGLMPEHCNNMPRRTGGSAEALAVRLERPTHFAVLGVMLIGGLQTIQARLQARRNAESTVIC
jgi:hypothetical protein